MTEREEAELLVAEPVAEPAHAPSTALHPNLVGGLWLIASALCFTVSTSLVKYLGTSFAAPVQTSVSQAISVLLLSPYIATHAAEVLRPKRVHLLLVQAGFSTLGLMLAFYSYHQLPLADANALSFTRTLWVFPMAALLLGERLRPPILVAGLVAFGGVLLISGAATGGFHFSWGIIAGLAGAVSSAIATVTVRGLSHHVSGMVLLIWPSMLGLAFSVPLAFAAGMRAPTPLEGALLLTQGLCSLGQQSCYIRGLQIGEVSAIAPFDYTRVLFVVLIGIVVFGEVPPPSTIGGMALIVGAAAYIMWLLGRRR